MLDNAVGSLVERLHIVRAYSYSNGILPYSEIFFVLVLLTIFVRTLIVKLEIQISPKSSTFVCTRKI